MLVSLCTVCHSVTWHGYWLHSDWWYYWILHASVCYISIGITCNYIISVVFMISRSASKATASSDSGDGCLLSPGCWIINRQAQHGGGRIRRSHREGQSVQPHQSLRGESVNFWSFPLLMDMGDILAFSGIRSLVRFWERMFCWSLWISVSGSWSVLDICWYMSALV